MKSKIIIALVLFYALSFVTLVYAEDAVPLEEPILPATVSIHLNISTDSQDINVVACDSDNNPETPENITPYCAILQSGIQNDWTWYSFGALLNSLDNIAGYTSKDKDGNDVYHYWGWSLNGTEAQVGLNAYDLKTDDLISLTFIDPVEREPELKPEPEPEPVRHSSGGGRTHTSPKPIFSTPNAINYLKSVQKEDGSFGGSDLYTDWVVIALGAFDADVSLFDKVVNYFNSHDYKSTLLTDNERHAMAILAIKENPYLFRGVNYIDLIIKSFDGRQFGDSELVNDDVFALIPLLNSGYTYLDEIISKDVAFIISEQKSNGSWEESVDLTSAAIQALAPLRSIDSVDESIRKASVYLEEAQEDDGGWGSVYSTSWATQAMNALGASWDKKGKTPNDYLAQKQESDGAMLSNSENLENRIWATSYAIPAMSGKAWTAILHPVSKPVLPLAPISVNILPNGNNTVAVVSVEKKPAVIAPVHISSPIVSQKVSPTISSTQVVTANALPATAEKSGASIPLIITVIVVVLAGGTILIRFIRHQR